MTERIAPWIREAAPDNKCPICGMKLCRHGVHPDDECWQCEKEAKDATMDSKRGSTHSH